MSLEVFNRGRTEKPDEIGMDLLGSFSLPSGVFWTWTLFKFPFTKGEPTTLLITKSEVKLGPRGSASLVRHHGHKAEPSRASGPWQPESSR